MATAAPEFAFPDHVPPELRWNHSLGEYAHDGDDPFLAVSRLHDGPDILYSRDVSQQIPGWIITRHALQQEAFTDWEHFTSEYGSGIDKLVGNDFRLIPIDYDPPEQVAFRRVLNPLFTPKVVRGVEDSVRATCDQLIDKFKNDGGCEFIADFAIPFPTYIFLALMGMPQDEAQKFLDWEAQMLRGATMQDRAMAALGVFEYLKGYIRQQREKPTSTMIEGIMASEISGEPVTDDQLLGIFYTLYVGGLDTVYSTIGWIMRHLALNPELQQTLRKNPELIEKSVDEFARAYSVVSTKRVVKQDVNFHGVEMKAGDIALMPLFLAGRDPHAWDNPHDIDLYRKPAALTFGTGPHLCVGRQLARREMRIAVESFLARFDNIRINPDIDYHFHTSPVFGVDSLPLLWD